MNKIRIKTLSVIVFGTIFVSFSISTILFAKENYEPYVIEGYSQVSGNGTLFRVDMDNDSFLDISSKIPLDLRVNTSDKMIVIENEPYVETESTPIILSGLIPLTTYYKYTDSYLNLEEIKTDASGSVSYNQDVGSFHFVSIQKVKSTKFISATSTGGDCISIGTWNNPTKTCTLTKDVFETIQINSSGITLDGNGHMISGTGNGFGVFISLKNNVVVKNLTVKGFFRGINITQTSQSNFSNNILENNVQEGIFLSSSENITLTNNKLIENSFFVSGATLSQYIHSIDISNTIDDK